MSGKIHELTGKKIGRLTVIRPVWHKNIKTGREQKKWLCECECGSGKQLLLRATVIVTQRTKSCGCLRVESMRKTASGTSNWNWKGGKRKNFRGYIEIKSGEHRGKFEHRILYENHYGIKLQPHQTVHHKNGIRDDNRIENLELWDSGHPSGQLVSDKLTHYFDMVKEYLSHPEYEHLIREQLKTVSDTPK